MCDGISVFLKHLHVQCVLSLFAKETDRIMRIMLYIGHFELKLVD